MRKIIFAAFMCCLAGAALAQSSPNFYQGFIPTAAQWRSYFAAKQDVLGYTAINKAGDRMLGLLAFVGTVPVLSACGTNPTIVGNNQFGTVTMGTGSPTGCVISFAAAQAYAAKPVCVVSWEANLAAMGYTNTKDALTLTQTGTSSNIVNYICAGVQ